MSKTIVVEFIKHPTDFRLAYFAGDIVAIEEKQARELIKARVAMPAEKSSDLPDDIPGRKELLAAELSFSEIKEMTDFVDIKGIGKALSEKIVKYLNP